MRLRKALALTAVLAAASLTTVATPALAAATAGAPALGAPMPSSVPGM
ncbi:hypothetical protein [Streptomyces sp. NPDC047014]